MAVIWGLDLHDIQWNKFKSSYMWNTDYHLRRTKFIVYQLAMISCVVSESLGTAVLTDYVDQQDGVKKLNPNATVHNNDYVGIASFNIFVGIYVATIFGSGFFFDLFWPERRESRAVRLAWKICSVLACIMVLADALALTIITAKGSARVTGVDRQEAQRLLRIYGKNDDSPPLRYRDNARAIAAVVFLWVGLPATIASTIIMWMSHKHDDVLGPRSKRGREANKAVGDVEPPPYVTGAPTTSRPETRENLVSKSEAMNGHNGAAANSSPVSGYKGRNFSPYNGEPAHTPYTTENSSRDGIQQFPA